MTPISWGLQILILTAGIHVFLRFVRTTRGNPLIRGLFLSVLVGVVGLWGFASLLGLEELEHILDLQGEDRALASRVERIKTLELAERTVMNASWAWPEGMTSEDSHAYMSDLLDRMIKPEIVYTHRWRKGDLLVIDNRATMHRAHGDYDRRQERELWRLIVQGDRPR